MKIMIAKALCFAVLAAVLFCTLFAQAAENNNNEGGDSSAPSPPSSSSNNVYKGGPIPTLNGLNQKQEAYQLMVWAFIVILVIGLMGFGNMASIDYSDDALLNSAPDSKMD